LLRSSGNAAPDTFTFTQIDVPGAFETVASGINDTEQIVGHYIEAVSGLNRGFLDIGGTFTTIDPPGSIGTNLLGINNSAQIVGAYTLSNLSTLGFLRSDGMFIAIEVPGARSTTAEGINKYQVQPAQLRSVSMTQD